MSTSYRLTAVSSGSTSGLTSGSTTQNTLAQQQHVPPPSVHFPTHQATVDSQSATTHVLPTIPPLQPSPPAKSSASPCLAMPRALGQASAASWFGACALIITLAFAIVMYEMVAWRVGRTVVRLTWMNLSVFAHTQPCICPVLPTTSKVEHL